MPVSAGGTVDLWISSATDSPDPVLAGNTLTYTFVVNGNTVDASAFLEDVRLYVYLPPWVTPTGVSSRPFS
ncbi:MAG: hypothetical protein H5T71_11485, partial [Chloroflexi bacterium]|nr:hypothetical protein [Chloroflexota bacterium]